MKQQYLIVLRETGIRDLDGAWMKINGGKLPQRVVLGYRTRTIVATGDVEWNGDTPAEVWVPEEQLDKWKAAHP